MSAPAAEATSSSASTAEDASPSSQQPTDSSTGTAKKKWQQLELPSPEQIYQQDMQDNCAIKSIISAGAGGVFGMMFGVFAVSMETSGSFDPLTGDAMDKPTRQVLRETFQAMRAKSWSYAKSFAYMGMIYSGAECMVEKYRAKHDKLNPAYAGCITGAILAYKAGPQAMCYGCAGFAAFSSAIEYFFDH